MALLPLTLAAAIALAGSAPVPGHKVIDARALSSVVPVFLLDMTGFEPPEGHPLAIAGLDPNAPVLPLFPC